MPDRELIEAAVRHHYAAAAKAAPSCCGGSVVDPSEVEVFGASRYEEGDLGDLPPEAVAASFGCANPVALAELAPGEVVLDLGSGGGIDVLLSARRVGPSGKAYGLDMTDEMLELARTNQTNSGVTNVEFLQGHIEAIPLPDASVDVVISNCVINLSTDKEAVFAEIHRVLRPGGRVCVADVVNDGEGELRITDDLAAWAGCLAGALSKAAYGTALHEAGLAEITITDSHVVADGFTSVFVRAKRPNRPIAS